MRTMTYELSREHEEFRRSVREFAEAEIAPHAARWDKDHHFPVDVVQKMGKLGLFGLTAPEEYGGAGEDGDFTSLCVAIEEIGRVDQSMGITLQAGVGLAHVQRVTVGVRVDGDAGQPGVLARTGHPHRDLAAVGDEDLLHRDLPRTSNRSNSSQRAAADTSRPPEDGVSAARGR